MSWGLRKRRWKLPSAISPPRSAPEVSEFTRSRRDRPGSVRHLARRLEHDAPSASILEGLDEILTVTRLGLPKELRRALACTNIVENVMSTVRRVCRNVKRW